MKRLNFIIICLLCLSLCFSFCYSCKKQNEPATYGVNIKTVKNISYDTLSVIQLDSVIKADTLPNFRDWSKTYIKDGESNITYEYSLLYDINTGIVYTIKTLRTNKQYVMQKRKTTSVKTTNKK